MLDVFGRYVVGWMVAHRESATLAERFIQETCSRQGIDRAQFTIHADRGPAMTSKPVALLFADLSVTKTHARPLVSQPQPVLGGAVQDAEVPTDRRSRRASARFRTPRAHCHVFFPWYNSEHHHSGLGLMTLADVHHGVAEQRVARATVLAAAYAAHPERFPAGLPHRRRVPRKCGSTHPRRPERPRRRSYTNLMNPLSHSY